MGAEVNYLLAIAINIVVSAAIGYILKPKKPRLLDAGVNESIRSPVAPRKVIYGEYLISGVLLYAENSNSDPLNGGDKHLHLIFALTGHPVEDIIGVLIDDEYFDISGSGTTANIDAGYYISGFKDDNLDNQINVVKVLGWGWANSTYVPIGRETAKPEISADKVRVGAIATFTDPVYGAPWAGGTTTRDSATGNYTQGYKATNCSYAYIRIKYSSEGFTGRPAFKFHLKGAVVYDPRDTAQDQTDPTTWVWSDNSSLCVLDYLTNTQYGLSAKYTDLYLPEIDVNSFIDAANTCEEQVLTGVSGATTAYQDRYRTNGLFTTNTGPINVMEGLLASCGGRLRYAQGIYSLFVGKYYEPNSDNDIIDETFFAGPLQVRTGTPRQDKFNKISGLYIQPYTTTIAGEATVNIPYFESADFPVVQPEPNIYETEDGEEIFTEVEFNFVTDEFQAQRLARIELERNRQGLILNFKANLKMLKYSVGDTVYLKLLSDSKYASESFFNLLGWDDTVQDLPHTPGTAYFKQFRILSLFYAEDNTINVTMQEEAPEIYDWNEGMAYETDYASNSSLLIGSLVNINTPILWATGLTTIVESIGPTLNGYNILSTIYWNAPTRATAAEIDRSEIVRYELQYGIITDPGATDYAARVATWAPIQVIQADSNVETQGPYVFADDLVKDGVTAYEIRMRSVIYSGRKSSWAYLSQAYTDAGTSGELENGYIVNNNPPTAPTITSITLHKIIAAPDWYVVNIDLGTDNMLIAGWDYVEVLTCALDQTISPTDANQVTPDDYAWVDLNSNVYQARINSYTKKLPNILTDQLVRVSTPVRSGAVLRTPSSSVTDFYLYNQPVYFWIRMVQLNGNVTDWSPAWTTGSNITSGYGPITPTNLVPGGGENLLDDDVTTGTITDGVDGSGSGTGPGTTGTANTRADIIAARQDGLFGVSRNFTNREINPP